MGYLFLFLALFAGLIKAYCGKQSSRAIAGVSDAVIITSARMLICALIGVILPTAAGESIADVSGEMLLFALGAGVFSAAFTVIWLIAVKDSMYMMVEVFVTGGVVIPLVMSAILYKESVGVLDIFGILLLFVGIYCITVGGKGEKVKWSFKGIFILILCLFCSGCSDLFQKIYAKTLPGASALVFNFYVYVFASAVLILVALFLHMRTRVNFSSAMSSFGSIWYYVAVMAVCLFLNSYFKTRAAGYLDAVVLYPVNQGLAIIFSSVMAITLFKERLNAKGFAGIVLTVAAIALINL